jgi:hypothetical protein
LELGLGLGLGFEFGFGFELGLLTATEAAVELEVVTVRDCLRRYDEGERRPVAQGWAYHERAGGAQRGRGGAVGTITTTTT